MNKHYLLTLALLFTAAIVWAQAPQPQPDMEPAFAWFDDPIDEAMLDLDIEAPEPPAPLCCRGPWLGERWELVEKLNLSDEQKKNLKAMRLKHQKEMIPLQGELRSKHIDLQSALQADKPDVAKINALVDQIAKVKADIQKKNIAFRLEMRSQLTPEQQKIWDEMRGRALRKFFHERRGFRGHGSEGRPPRGPF